MELIISVALEISGRAGTQEAGGAEVAEAEAEDPPWRPETKDRRTIMIKVS